MGEAKRRGTIEVRIAESQQREAEEAAIRHQKALDYENAMTDEDRAKRKRGRQKLAVLGAIVAGLTGNRV